MIDLRHPLVVRASRMPVARLGDAASARAFAAGVLGGHQAQVTHEVARVLEAA